MTNTPSTGEWALNTLHINGEFFYMEINARFPANFERDGWIFRIEKNEKGYRLGCFGEAECAMQAFFDTHLLSFEQVASFRWLLHIGAGIVGQEISCVPAISEMNTEEFQFNWEFFFNYCEEETIISHDLLLWLFDSIWDLFSSEQHLRWESILKDPFLLKNVLFEGLGVRYRRILGETTQLAFIKEGWQERLYFLDANYVEFNWMGHFQEKNLSLYHQLRTKIQNGEATHVGGIEITPIGLIGKDASWEIRSKWRDTPFILSQNALLQTLGLREKLKSTTK